MNIKEYQKQQTDQRVSGLSPETKDYPLTDSKDLDAFIERVGDAHCVMLGEASHGTHEFYTWRTAITKRLIQEKGFRFIAVEGDWPDCYKLNRYVKGYSKENQSTQSLLSSFRRWPTWMWANWEADALFNWLKNYNENKSMETRAGFYGLDVYSLWESLEAMNQYLRKNDPDAAEIAAAALQCLEPYGESGQQYALQQLQNNPSCRNEIIALLRTIRSRAPQYDHDPEAALNMEQNGEIALNAEAYYTNMVSFNDNTWNMRDSHMMDTYKRLMRYHGHGPDAKGIVWAHNTHVGDASYTDMQQAGMYNIGQLARSEYGRQEVILAGFSTFSGTVIAGKSWDAPMEVMEVPKAMQSSIEFNLHHHFMDDRLLIFDRDVPLDHKLSLTQRAIGVVYHPEDEQYNYVPTAIEARYDVLLYIDQTTALHPLHIHPDGHKIPETYPFAF